MNRHFSRVAIRHPAPESCNRYEIEREQPATSNQKPATSNQQPETSNQQPANQQPETSNQQPVAINQQSVATHPFFEILIYKTDSFLHSGV